MFNAGLAAKQTERYEEALRLFHKLRVIMPTSPEVMYHIADMYAPVVRLCSYQIVMIG